MGSRKFFYIILGLLICLFLVPSVIAFYLDPGDFIETVILTPNPQYQKGAEEWQKSGNECAEKCHEYSVKMANRQMDMIENSNHSPANGWSRDEVLNDPNKLVFLSNPYPGYGIADQQMADYYDMKAEYCRCARHHYNMALSLTGDKDYRRQASIWADAAETYYLMGDGEAVIQCENAAAASAAMDVKKSLFVPLPEWIALTGLIGGLYLIHRRRK